MTAPRYTRKDAEAALGRLALATGCPLATSWDDVGGLQLDYMPSYGGFVVNRIVNAQGGVSTPFGHQRHNAREFCDMVRFALNAMVLETSCRK